MIKTLRKEDIFHTAPELHRESSTKPSRSLRYPPRR